MGSVVTLAGATDFLRFAVSSTVAVLQCGPRVTVDSDGAKNDKFKKKLQYLEGGMGGFPVGSFLAVAAGAPPSAFCCCCEYCNDSVSVWVTVGTVSTL